MPVAGRRAIRCAPSGRDPGRRGGLAVDGLGQLLLGNGLDVPVIEITLGGFAVVAEEAVCSLAGADLGAQVDGEALARRSFKLRKGQTLKLTQPVLGARAWRGGARWFQCAESAG